MDTWKCYLHCVIYFIRPQCVKIVPVWSCKLFCNTFIFWVHHLMSWNYYFLLIQFSSLRPSDAIWWQWSGSTLSQVMVYCLTTPSHYLNQCWLITSLVPWHSSEGITINRSRDTYQWNKITNRISKTTYRCYRGQWVKWLVQLSRLWCSHYWNDYW